MSPVTSANGRPNNRFLSPTLAVLVFMGGSLLRSPGLFLSPRFWAEEGSGYYAVLQHKPEFWKALTLVVGGNYQLGINLSAWLATLVQATRAPYVTTGLATLVALVLVWNLGRLLESRGINHWIIAWAAACLALTPQGYELYFTVTNIQWVMGASLLLIALLPLDTCEGPRRWAYYGWISLCGFTGIPSIMLTPLFAYRLWRTGSRSFLYPTLVLTAGACLQLVIILTHSHDAREFPLDPVLTVTATLLQSLWSPLLTAGVIDQVITQSGELFLTGTGLVILVPLSAGLVGFTIRAIGQPMGENTLSLLLITWFAVCALNVIGSLGDPAGLISGWNGGRYFFLGALCYLMLLAQAINNSHGWKRLTSIGLAVLMLSTSVAEIYTGRWHDFIMHGPDWQQALAYCDGRRPCDVNIWPRGWHFPLHRN